ncbi:MAG: choice-of-anchor P family protein [Novosphingobium sp.]
MNKNTLLAAAVAVTSIFSNPANAATVVTSGAYAASASISAAGVVKASALFAPAFGTALPNYDDLATLLTINQSALLVAPVLANGFTSATESLKTDAVSAHAYSSFPTATGIANIDNAKFSLGTSTTVGLPLTALGISASAISSTTSAGVTGSTQFATGNSALAGLSVTGSVLGLLTIDGSLYSNPSPNTVLFNLLGVKVVLNEQQTVQNATSTSMFTNAIHVFLSDFLLDGRLLNGDVIVGHSQASVVGFVSPVGGVPEPETWALMMLGFGLVGGSLRARHRQAALLRA